MTIEETIQLGEDIRIEIDENSGAHFYYSENDQPLKLSPWAMDKIHFVRQKVREEGPEESDEE